MVCNQILLCPHIPFKWMNWHKQKNHLFVCQDSNWNQGPFSYLSFESIKELISGELKLTFINVLPSLMLILRKCEMSCNLISSNPNLFLQTLYQGSPEYLKDKHKESWQSLPNFAALQWFQIISWYK